MPGDEMTCPRCSAPTRVRNTYAEKTYDAKNGRSVPVVIRYRTCDVCNRTRKTVEVLASTLLTLGESK